ncbi:agmatine deiminase family protein [Aquiluna sp.]|nr:agmatine deiminase family protein [Aquiluna sp.]MDB4254392.1 agmatine deiminase family protein [Aquiluna sp.]
MPPEWEKHQRTFIAFPHTGYTLGNTQAEQNAARQAWASVANAASEYEKVTAIVHPDDERLAAKFLSSEIEVMIEKIDDAWIRDSGPTFVKDQVGKLAAIDWIFNGWGAQGWAEYSNDEMIASKIAARYGVELIKSDLVNEGGGIHINGKGQVLLTETVQLDPGRNPDWSKEQVEQELSRTLGVTDFVWLKSGLTRDYDEFGTRGHVDIVACYAPDGRVIYHDQKNPNHPDHLVSAEVRDQFFRRGQELVSLPAPETLKDSVGYVDYSYVNHYVLNNAVLLGSFDDSNDKEARSILRDCYPGREVVLLDARELFARGGGIHCITQQQPA